MKLWKSLYLRKDNRQGHKMILAIAREKEFILKERDMIDYSNNKV